MSSLVLIATLAQQLEWMDKAIWDHKQKFGVSATELYDVGATADSSGCSYCGRRGNSVRCEGCGAPR